MKQFLRSISPKRAVRDFVEVWSGHQPRRWHVLALAGAITFALFYLFIPDSYRLPDEKPDIIYISTFDEARTEREIIASNCHNQALKDELEDKLAQRAELARSIYVSLGRATFVDVDKLLADAEASRAQDEAAAAARTPPPGYEAAESMTLEEYCARAEG